MLTDIQRLMGLSEEAGAEPPADKPVVAIAPGGREFEIASVFQQAQANLARELLSRIYAHVPSFFEDIIIDVLLAMGYGRRRRDLSARLGRTGDGGVDGLISEDELGLDLIYVQAKRLKPGSVVAVSDVRDFAGSLDAHKAAKGVFVSTGYFSQPAVTFCGQVSRRIVLVDATQLAELMIRHNIGVKVQESYQFKRIDADYFATAASMRTREMISPSIQPRR